MNAKNLHTLGIDIGSTTVKIAILNDENEVLFSDYERHFANIQETLSDLLGRALYKLGPIQVSPVITGSGGLTLAKHLGVPFVQEVIAVSTALQDYAPQTDVAIELGGEDAKIIYFEGGNVEQRMNGVCAGGTGSFIDQMASLLQTDASGLNEYAKNYKALYSIAARCGVFAKTDIQPLINEGATKEDLSASIFQAVVNQTISGLACGKPIRGHVAFLGGPLHFLSELKTAFIRTLNLDDEHIIDVDNSHLFAAIGSALNAKEDVCISLSDMVKKLSDYPKLKEMLQSILFGGVSFPFKIENPLVNLGVTFGFLKDRNGLTAVSNRIFETQLYDLFLAEMAINSELYKDAGIERNRFIVSGMLQMDLVMEKFCEHYEEIYAENDQKFIEENGRKLFLLYLKPIINGTGNYYIEARTRDSRRTDVIVDYKGKRFIIELKIWRGNEYNTRGEQQLFEYLEFYNRLQHHPAVESACYTLMHFHYIWKNGSGTMSYDTLKTSAMYREVTPSYFTVFRVRGADECSPEELSRRASHTNDFVVTENTACRLLNPDINNMTVKGVELAGRFIHSGVSMRKDEPDSVRVAAVCENQKYNEYSNWSKAVYRIVQLGQGDFKISYGSIPYHDIFIRVKADADRPGFVESFRKEMKKQLRVGNLYLADIRPMSYYRNEHLADYRSDLYTYLAIAGFFLANAFLAILGTFWFRTQQRREELAVRLVAGATPHSLQTLLMGEGFLLTTIAYIPALVVAYNLGISDLVETWPVEWSFTRFLIGGLVTFLLLWAIAAISIWFPARQAMSIQPAEALHGE